MYICIYNINIYIFINNYIYINIQLYIYNTIYIIIYILSLYICSIIYQIALNFDWKKKKN